MGWHYNVYYVLYSTYLLVELGAFGNLWRYTCCRYLGIFLFILVREGWEGDLPLPCGVVYEVGIDFLEIDLDDLSVSFLERIGPKRKKSIRKRELV